MRPALLTATRLAFDDRSLSIDRPSSFPDGTDPWAADLTGALAAQALALTPVGRRPPDPRPTWSLVRPSDAPPELPRPILRLTHPWRRAAAARAAKALQAVVIPLCDRAPGRLCLDATALQYGATIDVQLTLGRWDGRRHALWTTTVRAVRRALTARHVTNPVLVHLLDLAHPGLPRWSWWRFVTTAGVHERRAISPG